MKHSCYAIVASVLLLAVSSNSHASNIYFLPGDAYFRTVITEGFLENQADDIPVTLRYKPTATDSSGHVGSSRLKFDNRDGRFHQKLKLAYHIIRSRYPKEERVIQKYKPVKVDDGQFIMQKDGSPVREESNPLSVFVYNADFDLEEHHLLHLYNENWKEEISVKNRDPIETVPGEQTHRESRKRGDEVSPLKVTRVGSPKEQAHLVPSGELMLVIVPNRKWLKQIATRTATDPKGKLNEQPAQLRKPVIFLLKTDGLYVRTLEGHQWSEEEKITYELLTKPKPGFF